MCNFRGLIFLYILCDCNIKTELSYAKLDIMLSAHSGSDLQGMVWMSTVHFF